MINFIKKKKINDYFLPIILIFFISINVVYFFLNLTNNVTTNVYAFNELFINYQAGFIRRGLLGELFWYLNENFLIDARVFFSTLFLILYLIQIYLLYKVLHNYKKNFLIYIIILFSPVFILFNIYDQNLYYIKDIFIKLSILFHSYIIIEHNIQKKFEDYLKKIKFLLFLY